MAFISYRAKVTRLDGGTTIIEPIRKSGLPRYEHMLQTEFMQLRRTKKDYIVVFRFPRVRGIIAATQHLISECARMTLLMYNEHFNHCEQ